MATILSERALVETRAFLVLNPRKDRKSRSISGLGGNLVGTAKAARAKSIEPPARAAARGRDQNLVLEIQ
jgi:hypothetical protein